MAEPNRNKDYDSGEDFVLELGELRFNFNEQDFRERTEQAALELKFIQAKLDEDEQADLVSLTVNGQIDEAQSPLGEHIAAQDESMLTGQPDRPPGLVYALRRLVFRDAWLDQGVIEGEFDVEFVPEGGNFGYIYVDNVSRTPVEIAAVPSWETIAYQGAPGP